MEGNEDDKDEDVSVYLYWFGIASAFAILVMNLPILWIIWKERIMTLIIQIIGIDSILCLAMIPIIFNYINVIELSCGFITSYAFFTSLLNRLLPVGIVIYRYVYVCHSTWVHSAHQRRIFHIILSISIILLAIVLTIGSWIYREKYGHFLTCSGREADFFSSDERINGFAWLLPIYHPFHFLSIFAFFLYAIMVPVGYILIYCFRRKDNYEVLGLNERSRLIRKHKNIVTTRFNIMNWIFEVTGFIVLIPGKKSFTVLYFLITCTVSPLLYYTGIELNRQAAKKRILVLFKDIKDSGE